MNTTTTTTTTVHPAVKLAYTTMSIQDEFFLYFKNPIFVTRLYQTGYVITVILGFFGSISSLMTFSRPTLRKVSTGCLFMALAISDMLYLLICVIDILEFGIQIPFYHHIAYNELCRFRMFIADAAQVASAWILVLVSVDRWIRTRFPFKSGSLCTPKKALSAVAILLVIDVGLHSHLLTPMAGAFAPGFSVFACGPNPYSVSYELFYFYDWAIIQVFTNCLVPAILMIVFLIDIIINIRFRKRAVIQPTQVGQNDQNAKRQKTLQRQMFILMSASIGIFLITSLPLGIYKITSPRRSMTDIFNTVYQILTVWTSLQWLQSLNYAITFYIHCLSSTLFRKEFKQQMGCLCGVKQSPVSVMAMTKISHRGQTLRVSVVG